MKIIKEIEALQSIADFNRATLKTIGFVPTMGFLHDGHVSLILNARKECDVVVVSIFVNPTQFGPNEDFEKYPRDFLRDFHICKSSGVDYVFLPDRETVYPENFLTEVQVKGITDKYEGKFRPGHFTGVATVVTKLVNIVKPHYLYVGQKDAQQAIILRKMAEDLNLDLKVKVCETMREETKLAMSSRNSYLTKEEKSEATVLYEALTEGKKMITDYKVTDTGAVMKFMENFIKRKSDKLMLQYIAVTDNYLMQEIEDLKNYEGELVISLAAYLGKTRLIDNIIFNYK